MNSVDLVVRSVEPADVPDVVQLVHDLAEYEREPDHCGLTTEQLRAALFCTRPALFGHVAAISGEVVGCALWFLNFSTWRGVHGVYIEDLYVRPDHRGRGIGRALLRELARECDRQGYARLEWAVLDWNEPAIGFYGALGAEPMDDWRIFRLSKEPLAKLAKLAGADVVVD
jgi:GNAT superfamily N-acetyltransferase